MKPMFRLRSWRHALLPLMVVGLAVVGLSIAPSLSASVSSVHRSSQVALQSRYLSAYAPSAAADTGTDDGTTTDDGTATDDGTEIADGTQVDSVANCAIEIQP